MGRVGQLLWHGMGVADREDVSGCSHRRGRLEPSVDEDNDIGEILDPGVVSFAPWSGDGVDLLGELLWHIGCFDFEVVETGKGQERAVSYTHLRAHETDSYLVCRL